ncbi:ABC transporter [Plectosphaerella plurivora]|uniref:ABC transporter n=1 Tax=Plectosphaerella plurivora TaxID=936078 RepID=A0A9P8V3E6_9PEZI|nr:ABC transporter [Plectosphaerella plurivora]
MAPGKLALNSPVSKFGLGEPRPIRSLSDGLAAADASRKTVVFVNSGLTGGDIDSVISSLSKVVTDAGKNATTLESPSDVPFVCRTSYRGTTPCYGAVVFHSSPDEGSGGLWNYTLRGDAALGLGFEVDEDKNDAQIYTIPLQRAVDIAIADTSSSGSASALDSSREWGFTDQTEEERVAEARRNYQTTFVNFLAIAFALALVGVTYHLPGHVATEREKGLTQLIDAMMPTGRDWEAQAARMLSTHCSFTTIYIPGWVVAAIISKFLIWENTNAGIAVVLFLLAGLALTSQATLGAVFFKKAQLSGTINSLVYILLGVLAQAIPNPNTGAVAVLGLLFTPCSLIFFIKSLARFEGEGLAMSLISTPPKSTYSLPAIVFWLFMLIQTFAYPAMAVVLERYLHGVGSDSRSVRKGPDDRDDAVYVQGLRKVYRPSLFRRIFSFVSKPRDATVAVDDLTLKVQKGQIVALLGANGSGKSTTLDAIAGISRFDSGNVSIDASGGVGFAPQKNVLWDELTVGEHLKIFNELKSPRSLSSEEELNNLIEQIGLASKKKARVATLSGGQKRKLQLGMMLTGGSALCCVDEVSSGIDPLSRRKIWDILLSERGRRTIIMTTHFLDEADLLADHIAILSKGTLRAEGSAVTLKNQMGAGYRINVLNARNVRNTPDVEGVRRDVGSNTITYVAPSSSLAAEVIRALEAQSFEYRISNPTIEDVFLQVAEEAKDEQPSHGASGAALTPDASEKNITATDGSSTELLTGKPTGFFKQVVTLAYKRCILFKTNWVPFVAAFLIPIVAAAIMQMLISGESQTSCSPSDANRAEGTGEFLGIFDDAVIVAGPSSEMSSLTSLLDSSASGADTGNITFDTRDSFPEFETFVEDNRMKVFPGGWWLGSSDESPTVVYRADRLSVYTAVFAQNALDTMRTNVTIATAYSHFDLPAPSSLGKALQLSIYFPIVMGIASAFFGLYPNLERRTHVRSLQYSSGVRSAPLWASHLLFDFSIFAFALILAAAVLVASSDIWYAPGYLFPVFILYGLASILLSQFATFAAIMAYNGVGFAIYLIAFLFIITFSPPTMTDRNVILGHYVISILFPTGSLCRALLVGLNIFSAACSGDELEGYPGAMGAYGAPIMYLALQSVLKNTAVDNVSFGVRHGEVFALLGPNGAGKSTTISLIRGDMKPDKNGGDVFVEHVPVSKKRALARSHLGVCPQFDAVDSMTVREHLVHYARLRGIADVEHQVAAVIRAVGLGAHQDVLAQHLSGGNRRKLSLGIALTGNPSVLLLDEPSSGLDAAAKRIMWRTLSGVAPGRSILLTTHSMEEADALAGRAGILAQRMLAAGDVSSLRERFGGSLYVHLVSRTAPHSSQAEMDALRSWVLATLPDAEVEPETYHGQMRFSVPAASVPRGPRSNTEGEGGAIGRLVVLLEENKEALGVEHHSVSPATLNDVFLSIVGKHDVREEGYEAERPVGEDVIASWSSSSSGHQSSA